MPRPVLLKSRAAPADGRHVIHASATVPLIRARLERQAPDAVLEWRFDELERVGVEVLDALRLSLDPTFDVARARSLIADGCSPGLAVQILG